jgi:hypothetical protein
MDVAQELADWIRDEFIGHVDDDEGEDTSQWRVQFNLLDPKTNASVSMDIARRVQKLLRDDFSHVYSLRITVKLETVQNSPYIIMEASTVVNPVDRAPSEKGI